MVKFRYIRPEPAYIIDEAAMDDLAKVQRERRDTKADLPLDGIALGGIAPEVSYCTEAVQVAAMGATTGAREAKMLPYRSNYRQGSNRL